MRQSVIEHVIHLKQLKMLELVIQHIGFDVGPSIPVFNVTTLQTQVFQNNSEESFWNVSAL